MNRFERVLAILLLLQGGKIHSATALAVHFGVSIRTIYRDIETLGSLGVPLYTEMGRHGGFGLVEGYFLPPIMFSTLEATTLLMGLLLLRRLHAPPFEAESQTAEQKLLTALPDPLRAVVTHLNEIIGFEAIPKDMFNLEEFADLDDMRATSNADERQVVSTFLRAIFEGKAAVLDYYSPYSRQQKTYFATPQGLLWDHDRWYLVGRYQDGGDQVRLWRADRVLTIWHSPQPVVKRDPFQISHLLGRTWLKSAMQQWMEESPVVIKLSAAQANRLKQDWYYGYARYEELGEGQVKMTFGEDNQTFVFNLLRWLGLGAELIEPQAWRDDLRDELEKMAAVYR